MFEPIADKVVIKPIDANDTTSGGVILPDISQEDTMMAEVIAVGPGAIMVVGSYCKMQTKPGDIVVYPKFGAKKVQYRDGEFFIIIENEILSILTEESNG